jgi:hypothetical protein
MILMLMCRQEYVAEPISSGSSGTAIILTQSLEALDPKKGSMRR